MNFEVRHIHLLMFSHNLLTAEHGGKCGWSAHELPNALGSGQAAAWPLSNALDSDISTSQRDMCVLGSTICTAQHGGCALGSSVPITYNDRWAVVIKYSLFRDLLPKATGLLGSSHTRNSHTICGSFSNGTESSA